MDHPRRRGTARLGFKFSDLFAGVSMMGAGPLQEDLEADAPRQKQRALSVLKTAYDGDRSYFLAVSPRDLAARDAAAITRSVRIRMIIGNRDGTYANSAAFHEYLARLGIPHEWIVLVGIGHDPMATLRALGER